MNGLEFLFLFLKQNVKDDNNFFDDLLDRLTSFASLQRIVATILRSVHNFRVLEKSSISFDHLTTGELLDVLLVFVNEENNFI